MNKTITFTKTEEKCVDERGHVFLDGELKCIRCEVINQAIGSTSICVSCKRPIIFSGKYWQHCDYSPRHPAIPMKLERPNHDR